MVVDLCKKKKKNNGRRFVQIEYILKKRKGKKSYSGKGINP